MSADDGDHLRVLFVCQDDFRAPTEKQVLGSAQELLRRGHAVMVSIGRDASTTESEGVDQIPGLRVGKHRFVGRRLRRESLSAARAFAPTVIHAALSRVSVIAAARHYGRATGAPVFVHFGDDEWRLPPAIPGESIVYPIGRFGRRLACRAYPPAWSHSTPASLRWAARRARALDALTPALAAEVSSRLGRDCSVLLPVMPRLALAEPADASPESPTPLPAGPTVLFTGAILREHVSDVAIALRAVAEVQSRGIPLSFVHAGSVHPRIDPSRLVEEAGCRADSAVFLGYLPFGRIPSLLRAASVLLQPGAPSEFNRLRLPAKLEAYLASGTPTITFATGFGELLAEGKEVLKTHTGDPGELADRIVELLEDRELRRTLQANAPAAAGRLFDPVRNTDALLEHYRLGIEGRSVRRHDR